MSSEMKRPWKVLIHTKKDDVFVSSHASGKSAISKAHKVGGFVVIPEKPIKKNRKKKVNDRQTDLWAH